jgi:hypothetical protein
MKNSKNCIEACLDCLTGCESCITDCVAAGNKECICLGKNESALFCEGRGLECGGSEFLN